MLSRILLSVSYRLSVRVGDVFYLISAVLIENATTRLSNEKLKRDHLSKPKGICCFEVERTGI